MAKIAISYRRSDSQDITGRIFDRLAQQYGKSTVFRDIDSIQPGIDFRTQIAAALRTTDVLLVMVGPRWLGRVEGMESRIDNEADPVRLEVETALKRDIPIIPVLVSGMKMPEAGQLPTGLRDFAYRHAVTVDGGRDFDHHVDGLIRALDQFFAAKGISPSNQPAALRPETASKTEAPLPPRASPMRAYGLAGGLVVVVLVLAAILFRNETGQTVSTAPGRSPSVSVPSVNPTSAAGGMLPSEGEAARAWAVTKDSSSIAVLNDFIRQFGDTPYGSMARARVQELQKSQAAATAQPAVPAPQPRAPDVQTSASPGFDCSKSHAADQLEICRNGELSFLDRQLNTQYNAMFGRLDKSRQTALSADEQAWLKQRAKCLSDDACIRDAYQTRMTELRTWQ
jgi:uncharacterized protein YecT (DUF1311 family)